MSEAIIVAVISAVVTLAGVLISNGRTQAAMEVKIENLTKEVQKHNNFAARMPVLEEQMKVANHRIDDLEELERIRRNDK